VAITVGKARAAAVETAARTHARRALLVDCCAGAIVVADAHLVAAVVDEHPASICVTLDWLRNAGTCVCTFHRVSAVVINGSAQAEAINFRRFARTAFVTVADRLFARIEERAAVTGTACLGGIETVPDLGATGVDKGAAVAGFARHRVIDA
jgi:hypothetical protein